MWPTWPVKHWRITVPLGPLPEKEHQEEVRKVLAVIDLRLIYFLAVTLIALVVLKVLP